MKKHYWQTILSSLVAGLFLSLLFIFGFFTTWSAKLTDKLFLQGRADPEIVIITIDNDSLQKIGRWPWDRKIHALLLNKLSEQVPAVIGYDVNFPETSNTESDKALAEAIKNSGNVILPIEAELKIQNNKIITDKLLYPIQEIKDAAFGLGMTNTPADEDGIFRKLPIDIYTKQDDTKLPSFANLLANQYLLKDNRYLNSIPKDNQGRMIVNFSGRPKTITMIPALTVMENKLKPDELKNKIVLIGSTASDLHDEMLTPVSRSGAMMSGVEIHANATETIINNKFLKPLDTIWQILILLGASLLLGIILSFSRILWGTLASLIILAVYILIAIIAFDYGLIFDLLYFIFTVFLVYLTVIVSKFLLESKEKKYIKNTFGRYVSQQIINELIAHPEKLKLGGEKKELTILFSDIRGFTSISEKLSPERLVNLLNEYLTTMTNTIMDTDGVIDKFIGDAIMAFWGAPIDDQDHAVKSVQAAWLMSKKLAEMKNGWLKKYDVDLKIGIGINSGEVVIGNLGSDKRFDYTVIGDTVNLSSRLESLTKLYGVQIIVSQFTKDKTNDKFYFRPLDLVVVKGKAEAVEIFELICPSSEIKSENKKMIENFTDGIYMYRNKQWDKAIAIFEELKKEWPDDVPTKIYLDRCQELKNNPPDSTWNGVYHLTNK